ncbi:hypothetical protein FCIRC_4735 [Fusarium circinatum]|uniref:Uncharacterized protein n=1 Tax=Fusarium circinatum TaxID=48490 RepID=A0A8H5X688_FUSCI|nr:hypothetical protein FCIRC_4735 [Fusarium circinatum]
MSLDETSSPDVIGSDSGQEGLDSYPFPMKNKPADEVEIESKRRGKSIYQNYELLRRILERHEGTIQKRWLKKNRKQRLEVLLTAWPDMPPTHRPFYDTWRQVDTDPDSKVKHHSSISWPYINKESLGKPTPFLLLLNSRGRHPPPLFLDNDAQYAHKAGLTGMMVERSCPTEHMSILLRGVPEDDYGIVRKYPEAKPGVWLHLSNKDYDWPTSTIYGKEWPLSQYSVAAGMVILEIQERLMDFLVKCCYRILHEIEPHNLFSDVYPVQAEPELPSNAQTEGLQTSLLEITFEAPYRVPTRLKFANLEKLFAARAAAAEDHIWAMREDPNYFAEQISDMYDHVLLVGETREHKNKWGAAIGQVLADAYTMLEFFTEAHRITKRLCELQEKPWSQGFAGKLGEEATDCSVNIIKARLDILRQIHEAFESSPAPDLLPFFENNLGKFTYQEHRRRNKENVEMMRRAESNLDAFWARADQYLYERTKSMNDSILMELLKSPRVLQRTPEWVEPTKEKKKVLNIEQPLSTFFFGLSNDERDTKASGRLSVKPTKAKLKTRGTTTEATEADEAPTEAMAEVVLEDLKPVFKVDRRALRTFRILFYDPDVTSTPGEVPWNDFLHALTSVGLAAEKLYGSVWQFSPYTLEADGSIHFHEPHPHNKVPFFIARRHGRRLYRTYGWTGEQFVLDK